MSIKSILRTLTVASTALLIASGSAYAEKPDKGNGNQGKNKEQSEQRGQKENRKGGGNEKGNRVDGAVTLGRAVCQCRLTLVALKPV